MARLNKGTDLRNALEVYRTDERKRAAALAAFSPPVLARIAEAIGAAPAPAPEDALAALRKEIVYVPFDVCYVLRLCA